MSIVDEAKIAADAAQKQADLAQEAANAQAELAEEVEDSTSAAQADIDRYPVI